MQQRHPRESQGIERQILIGDKRGGTDGDNVLREQQIGPKACPERRACLPHRKVDPVRVKAGNPLGRGEAEINAGMGTGQVRQTRDEPFGGEGRRDADRCPRGGATQRIRRLGKLRKGARDSRMVGAPFLGEGQTPRMPQEQAQAEMVFQSAHLLGNGALRHAQIIGGGAEIQVPARGREGAEAVQRRQCGVIGHDRISTVT